MKNRRFIIIITVLIIVALFLPSLFKKSYLEVINSNWNIQLPEKYAEEIYSYSTESFHGDGIRYHIIDYPVSNDKNRKVEEVVFQLEKLFFKSSKPTAFQLEYVKQLLSEIDVPPDTNPLQWYNYSLIYQKQDDGSELFMFYDSSEGTLYIVESFL